MAVLRVREPFSCDIGGVFRTYRIGDLVPEDDSVVTPTRLRFFEPVETAALRSVTVEQATAAPNERRTVTTTVTRKKADPHG